MHTAEALWSTERIAEGLRYALPCDPEPSRSPLPASRRGVLLVHVRRTLARIKGDVGTGPKGGPEDGGAASLDPPTDQTHR